MRLSVLILMLLLMPVYTVSAATDRIAAKGLTAPLTDELKYPYDRENSVKCGRWKRGSQDYPYFGAPRNNGKRKHAGVDIYPVGGAGSPVMAVKSGYVVKIAPFYIRANGEVTYGVLVDHGDFSINYAELRKPVISASSRIEKGDVIGTVSGTAQLHFELYSSGTTDWIKGWYGEQPANLIDPTELLKELYSDSRLP
jgi:murein DD-endopeptidase MepM/ murein hydrolase activator NlpD